MRDDARIAKLLKQLRDAVAERITELDRPLEAKERTVAAQVEQRKQLASQLQLPERLLKIYNAVKYYPHWARNSPEHVSPLITDVDVVEEEEGSRHKTTVQFSLKSCRYSFLFDEDKLYDERYRTERYYASLTLSGVNGEALFRLSARSASGYHRTEYEKGETLAFVPGDWILDFIELSQAIAAINIEGERRFQLYLIESQIESQKSQIESQKRDFGLDVPKSEVQKLQATLGSHSIGEERRSAGVAARAVGRWLRRLFGQRHDGGSEAS